MNAYFTKGKKTARIMTSGNVVIIDFDPFGDGFQGTPYRSTVADPEVLAEERAANYVADGYTREDV